MQDLELLANGYGTVEGPTVDADGSLYFSDITGGGVYRWREGHGVETVIARRRGVGGVCLHRDGGIVVAGRDISHVRDGVTRILAAPAQVAAHGGPGRVGGFNDLHADDQGRVLAGSVRLAPDDDTRLPGDLVLIRAEGDVKILYGGVMGSNGIALDWKTRRLFHCSSYGYEVIVSQFVGPEDAEIIQRFPTSMIEGIPDGLVLDEEGFVWIAFYRGGCIARFTPEGELVERYDMPANEVASLCFGGDDGRTLFITTEDNTTDPALRGCVFRTRMKVSGAPVGEAAI